MKRLAIIAATLFACLQVSAQKSEYPVIGAQVFIEPGQTPEQIDGWFRILKENDFEVARIRMFGSQMLKADGTWDFSLYDTAFAAAEKYGIKLFATLFPPTDELSDVGGFKFPKSEAHLAEVAEYIKAVVCHFRTAPALSTWVLQNEPGTGGMKASPTSLSQKKRAEWDAANPAEPRNGYLKADFRDQDFLSSYLDWYLGWIADEVMKYDPDHYRHVNPHQILETLPEYDFKYLSTVLTSLGASMHLSWHFGYFERPEYPAGVSMMSDIIRGNAMQNPFWITELQGGNVTASGYKLLCPTADEISQWLWTGVSAGAEGIIFWTLNQRKAVCEAGEWGLLTFQDTASDRLTAAAGVARSIKQNKSLFADAKPAESEITILYNTRSLWIQAKNAATLKDDVNDARQKGAVMKSAAAAYDAISSWGVTPDVRDMANFDWTKAEGKTVVLPNCISIPAEFHDGIRTFVRNGGRLVITGLSGFYDGNMACQFMGGFPLADVFGSELSEFKVGGRYLWEGFFPDGSTRKESTYGKGSVLWFPSLLNLSLWHKDEAALRDFYGEACKGSIKSSAISFAEPHESVLVRKMDAGDKVIAVFINKESDTVDIKLRASVRKPKVIFDNKGGVKISTGSVRLSPEQCIVTVWDK